MNTLKSHCMLEYARSVNLQNEAAEALFHAYFEEGRNINSNDVLQSVSRDINLDDQQVLKSVESEESKGRIKLEAKNAHHRGISGVPYFDVYIDGLNEQKPLSFSGAQGPKVFADVFKRLLNALKSKA